MEKDLTAEFLHIMNRMKKIKFHTHHAENEVHNSEGMMLFSIHRYYESKEEAAEDLRVSELARSMCMSKSAVSKMLNTLEEKELAERYIDKQDRRAVYIRLTKKGEDFIEHSQCEMRKFTEKIIGKLGKEELENLVRILGHLYEILKEESEQYHVQN